AARRYTLSLHDALPISGVAHFWWQRVTAVVLALLVPWLVGILVSFIGADLATVYSVLSTPLNAILLAAFVLALFWHAKLGMQVRSEEHTSELQSRENLV